MDTVLIINKQTDTCSVLLWFSFTCHCSFKISKIQNGLQIIQTAEVFTESDGSLEAKPSTTRWWIKLKPWDLIWFFSLLQMSHSVFYPSCYFSGPTRCKTLVSMKSSALSAVVLSAVVMSTWMGGRRQTLKRGGTARIGLCEWLMCSRRPWQVLCSMPASRFWCKICRKMMWAR